MLDGEWKRRTYLAKVKLGDTHLDHTGLVELLTGALTAAGVESQNIVSFNTDRASINRAAWKYCLFLLWRRSVIMPCLMHCAHNAYEAGALKFPFAQQLFECMSYLLSGMTPDGARVVFSVLGSSTVSGIRSSRFFHQYDSLVAVADRFHLLSQLVIRLKADNVAPATTAKLEKLLRESESSVRVDLEACKLIGRGLRHFATAVETDDPDKLPQLIEDWDRMRSALRSPQLDGVVATMTSAGWPAARVSAQARYFVAAAQAMDAYLQMLVEVPTEDGGLGYTLALMKTAYYFDPRHEMNRDLLLRNLRQLRFVNEAEIEALDREVGKFVELAAAEYDWENSSVTKWLRDHEREIPAIAAVAKKVLTVPLSSAAAERVFSLLRHYFPPRRNRAGEDLIAATLRQVMRNNGQAPFSVEDAE